MSAWPGWEYDVLVGLIGKTGTISPAAVQLVRAWHSCEGGTATFNPMNTTQPYTGATDYNSVGVKNYPSRYAGLQATLITLRNGHYDGIVLDLTTGTKSAQKILADNASEFSTWGTSVACIARSIPGKSPVATPSYPTPAPPAVDPATPGVGQSRLPGAWDRLTVKLSARLPNACRQAVMRANLYRRLVKL